MTPPIGAWVPELATLPDGIVHQPWKATPAQLFDARGGARQDISRPVVDHAKARQAALAAYQRISREDSP